MDWFENLLNALKENIKTEYDLLVFKLLKITYNDIYEGNPGDIIEAIDFLITTHKDETTYPLSFHNICKNMNWDEEKLRQKFIEYFKELSHKRPIPYLPEIFD